MLASMHADRLSPFKFYQFLLTNTTDKDVTRFLRMLTFLSLEEIQRLEESMSSSSYKPNTAQRVLAREVTAFVHGPEGLRQAEAATQVPKSLNCCSSPLAYRETDTQLEVSRMSSALPAVFHQPSFPQKLYTSLPDKAWLPPISLLY